jgi:hypothetical protein
VEQPVRGVIYDLDEQVRPRSVDLDLLVPQKYLIAVP